MGRSGSQLWRLSIESMESRTLSFGAYPHVSPSLARERWDECEKADGPRHRAKHEAQGGEA